MKPRSYGPFPYSLISQRPPLKWPNGARVASGFFPTSNRFRCWNVRAVSAPAKIPDIPTWAVRDYGNRVGIARIMQVLDRYSIRATVALNSDICINHPAIIEEGCARKWEWMGHNQSNTRRLNRGERRRRDSDYPRPRYRRSNAQRVFVDGLAGFWDCRRHGTRWTTCRPPAASMWPIGALTTISPT